MRASFGGYFGKIRLNHGIEINQGKPKVSYREILTEAKLHREKLSKQNGGSGQFADISFEIGPRSDNEHGLEFINMIKGGVIPGEFIPSVEKGFREAMEQGPLKGYPLESMKITLLDGSFHAQDSAALILKLLHETDSKLQPQNVALSFWNPLCR